MQKHPGPGSGTPGGGVGANPSHEPGALGGWSPFNIHFSYKKIVRIFFTFIYKIIHFFEKAIFMGELSLGLIVHVQIIR